MQKNRWFKSSLSSGGDNCVEVMHTSEGQIFVRHSREHGVDIEFTESEWQAFTSGVHEGEFEL